MKTTIYYFSGTGNSLWVAKNLMGKIDGCELVPIARISEQANIVAETEIVGLVFPVHYFGIPLIVEEFIDKLDLGKTEFIFSVMTMGGLSGRAIYDLEKKVEEKNHALNASFNIFLPDNYILHSKLPSGDKQKTMIIEAEKKIDEIVNIVKARQRYVEKENPLLKGVYRLLHKGWLKRLPTIDQRFYLDDNCNSCGVCEKVCPVNNIKLMDGKPQWGHSCQECLACLHFCPQIAIQRNKKTESQGRYHHPGVAVKDIIGQKK